MASRDDSTLGSLSTLSALGKSMGCDDDTVKTGNTADDQDALGHDSPNSPPLSPSPDVSPIPVSDPTNPPGQEPDPQLNSPQPSVSDHHPALPPPLQVITPHTQVLSPNQTLGTMI